MKQFIANFIYWLKRGYSIRLAWWLAVHSYSEYGFSLAKSANAKTNATNGVSKNERQSTISKATGGRL